MMRPHRCTGGRLLGGKCAGGETFVVETRVRNSEVQEGAGLVLALHISGVQKVSSGASVINTCFLSFFLSHCVSVRHTRIECLDNVTMAFLSVPVNRSAVRAVAAELVWTEGA